MELFMSKDVKILLEILSNEHVYSLNVLKEKLRNILSKYCIFWLMLMNS